MPRPVIVTAELAGPYIDNGNPVHLDALLTLAWARRHNHLSRRFHRSDPAALVEDAHLPLARVLAEDRKVWTCTSHIEHAPSTPAAVYQTRRRDPQDWDWYDKPVNVATGPTKDCLIRREARVTFALRWLAWGSAYEIRKALRLLWGHEDRPNGFVGAVRRSGAGEIVRWRVEEGSHTMERCYVDEDGRPARHLPAMWVLSCTRWRQGSCRAPYHLDDHRETVPHLGGRVTLRPEVLQCITREQDACLHELRKGGVKLELSA